MVEARLRLVQETVPENPPVEGLNHELVCAQVQQMTHDVKTFVLALPTGVLAQHLAGQFVTVTATIDGEQVSRCYTLSSPPTRPGTVAITVKRQADGVMSNWLHDHLQTGARLHVQGPSGSFTADDYPAPHYLFVTAGSGITPALAMARAMFDAAHASDIVLMCCARTPDDLIARAELEAMAAASDRLRLVFVCEDDSPRERWHGFRGRLTSELLAAAVPDAWARETFICGPQPFMDAAHTVLRAAGVMDKNRHDESFDIGSLPAPSLNEPATEAATDHLVTFARSGVEARIDGDQTILQAAKNAGLRLPNSCAMGVCGTCKQQVLEGDVDLRHGGGIRPKEIAAGKTLICCAKPTSDVVIDA